MTRHRADSRAFSALSDRLMRDKRTSPGCQCRRVTAGLHPEPSSDDAGSMDHHEHHSTPPRARARVATRPDFAPAFAGLLLALLLLGLLLL